jgi:hypothetical protein
MDESWSLIECVLGLVSYNWVFRVVDHALGW